ncbi:hypothetical protein [Paenibacillus radicis (ex Xue et al. 2023)]|uniref:Apea-like HEPN domain-containing protein n=1 Tax=Paenibacillus radicis (ex Xue et al. 2023) TaxID=2972489 RepID=A0ABT1YRG5_9BACL|nr:hypothetical protein [Paenibacillus radicis (ex Xue et al. 2023)]MCR8635763.1 hypothetical protein [Paenibacillus radicis (ex Xue et al. 2023)]
MEPNKGFLFIGDTIRLEDDIQEFQIIEGYVLKKASETQVEGIKSFFSNNADSDFFRMNYETIPEQYEDHTYYRQVEKFNDWNYWIVEYDEEQSNFNLSLSLLLSKINLFPLFEKHKDSGKSYQNYAYQIFVAERKGGYKLKQITESDIQEIREIYHLLEGFGKEKHLFKYINKAINDYWLLRLIPKSTLFYTVGMFAILEALLVHHSQTISILHQLKTKLNLLNNRLEPSRKIKFQEFFGEVKYETIISKLYSYRSDIAHGDFSDFKGELNILVDHKLVIEFIHHILKSVIVQSLREPQLIMDLKNC